MKYYFSRRTQLDKHLGDKYKFEAAEFGVEADSRQEAEKEVKEWMELFFKKCKAKLEKPKKTDEEPFTGKEFIKSKGA